MFLPFLILLPLCYSLAITPFPPVSLISPSSNVSSILSLSDASRNPQCVNTGRYPEWHGYIRYADCQRALSEHRTITASIADDLLAFYTSAGGFKPPPSLIEQKWLLPSTITYGTCVVQVRMLRDFRAFEVPTAGGLWVVPEDCAPAQITTWRSILREAEAVMDCVRYGEPGWASEGSRIVRQKPKPWGEIGILFWSQTSKIASTYETAAVGGVNGGGAIDAVATA